MYIILLMICDFLKVFTSHKIVWNASLMSRLMIEMRQFLFRKGLYIYLTFLHSFYCFTFLKPKGMDSFILERNLFYSITFFTRLFASIRKTYPQIAFSVPLDRCFIEVKQKLVVLTRKNLYIFDAKNMKYNKVMQVVT